METAEWGDLYDSSQKLSEDLVKLQVTETRGIMYKRIYHIVTKFLGHT